jgi:hypothetical protein
MSNRDICKSYSAEGAILPCRIVKVGAADYGVLQAAAVADKIIGVSMPLITVASGDSVDVMHDGIGDLQLGGTVARGDFLTTDGSGNGVTAAPAAGTNNQVVGKALVSGVSGDIIPVLLNITMVQG